MFYAVARCELLLAASASLKDKRSVLNHLKDRLRSKFHLSISEIELQDLQRRAVLGIALVVSGPARGREALAAVLRSFESEPRITVLEWRTRVAKLEDDGEGPDAEEWSAPGFEGDPAGDTADEESGEDDWRGG